MRCEEYGRLYTWAAAIDSVALASDEDNPQICGYGADNCKLPTVVQGICPEGWHVPTMAEFKTLNDNVGGIDNAGKMLKSASGWNSSGNGIDAYGFSVLPTGHRYYDGRFFYEGDRTYLWSASESNSDYARYQYFSDNSNDALQSSDSKRFGLSLRCLKDS